MRAYTLSYLIFCSLAACTEQSDPKDAGSHTHQDAGHHEDAGPQHCDTQGTWKVTFDKTDDRCQPRDAYELMVTRESIDLEASDAGVEGECGPRRSKVMISAQGCSVEASSLSTSCFGGEPQCQEYKLELKVHGDTADVTGSYRRCWCSGGGGQGGGWMGSVVPITGKAVRM